jgi:hypothetical protein
MVVRKCNMFYSTVIQKQYSSVKEKYDYNVLIMRSLCLQCREIMRN